MTSLADAWLKRLGKDCACDLASNFERFPELRDALVPPSYSVVVQEGILESLAEANSVKVEVRAQLLPPGVESVRDDEESGKRGGAISVALNTETALLKIEDLRLPKAEQGRGYGTAVIAQLADLGERLGLKTMQAVPAQIGRWAWIRCGFDFMPEWRDVVVEQAEDFARVLGREVDLAGVEHAWDFIDLPGSVSATELKKAGATSAWQCDSAIPVGKALLLGPKQGPPWKGFIRLDRDSPGRTRLDEYAASRRA